MTQLTITDVQTQSTWFTNSTISPVSSTEIDTFAERRQLRTFIDSLDVPVLLLEEDARVRMANFQAHRLLGKTIAEIEGHLSGDVFDCRFAPLPGGCGQTSFCDYCTLRQMVVVTFADGIAIHKSTAFVRRHDTSLRLEISTARIADLVLLRIDGVNKA